MTDKSLSYLIEAALEKEAVLMAAKAVTDKLERVAKELAKMTADDVIPLGDSMRDLFGAEQATSFESMVSEKINGLLEQVRGARNEISDQIDALASGEPMNDMNSMSADDMFADQDGGDSAAAPDAGAGEQDSDPFAMGDEQQDDADFGGQGLDSDFGSDLGGPAGRPQKESARSTKKVLENFSADSRLTAQFAIMVNKGSSVSEALNYLSENYALSRSQVAKIVLEHTNKG
jgi:hypothetical protein